MNIKLLLVCCLMISSNSFAQSIFRQTNAAPVEDRVIKRVEIIERENPSENCIGVVNNKCTLISVESSAVSPQSSLSPVTLEPMSQIDGNSYDFPEKKEMLDTSKHTSDHPIALAAYPTPTSVSLSVKDNSQNKSATKKVDKNISKPDNMIKKVEKTNSNKSKISTKEDKLRNNKAK